MMSFVEAGFLEFKIDDLLREGPRPLFQLLYDVYRLENVQSHVLVVCETHPWVVGLQQLLGKARL